MQRWTARSSGPWALILLGTALLISCGPTYPKCETDDHCAEQGEVCVDGTCQQCRDDAQCAEGQRCNGGRCEEKPECDSDADCDGKVCRSGKCQDECTSNDDCGSGLKCQDNKCIDELACNGTSDCAAGLNCEGGRCTQVSAERCILPAIEFGFNEANLTGSAQTTLQEAANCIKAKGARITVEGHCDERGTVEFNLALGDRRARSVKKFLTSLGVDGSKLRILSKGELEPRDNGHNEAAWARNRRAELIE